MFAYYQLLQISATVLLLLSTTDAHANVIDWHEWREVDGGNGHFYGIVQQTLTWQDAEALAVSYGGHLASVSSLAENNFIYSHDGRDVWIGLNDAASEGNFVWSSGEPVTYTNWRSGEPNGSTLENYVIIRWEEGQWNDHHNPPLMRSVIELDVAPVPEPSTLILAMLGASWVCVFYVRRRNLPYFGIIKSR